MLSYNITVNLACSLWRFRALSKSYTNASIFTLYCTSLHRAVFYQNIFPSLHFCVSLLHNSIRSFVVPLSCFLSLILCHKVGLSVPVCFQILFRSSLRLSVSLVIPLPFPLFVLQALQSFIFLFLQPSKTPSSNASSLSSIRLPVHDLIDSTD